MITFILRQKCFVLEIQLWCYRKSYFMILKTQFLYFMNLKSLECKSFKILDWSFDLSKILIFITFYCCFHYHLFLFFSFYYLRISRIFSHQLNLNLFDLYLKNDIAFDYYHSIYLNFYFYRIECFSMKY